MKINIGPYTNWIGPYQIAEKLLFWMNKDADKRVFKFGCFLAHGTFDTELETDHETWLYKVCNWIQSKKKRRVKIHIDRYDTWSMNHTLAPIIYPMLVQLQENKHGAPYTDDEDVPEELRSTSAPPKDNEWDTDENHFKRWDWIMDEMIWAFRQLVDNDGDWEAQFSSGNIDMKWLKTDRTYPNTVTGEEEATYQMIKGPKDTYKFDQEGYDKHLARMQNGFRLFGKYYMHLWD